MSYSCELEKNIELIKYKSFKFIDIYSIFGHLKSIFSQSI